MKKIQFKSGKIDVHSPDFTFKKYKMLVSNGTIEMYNDLTSKEVVTKNKDYKVGVVGKNKKEK